MNATAMPAPRTRLIVALTLFSVAFVAASLYGLWAGRKQVTRQSAQGTLLRADFEETSWTERSMSRRGYTITFAFETEAGEVVEDVYERMIGHEPGNVKVCYNPADPADHFLYDLDVVCGRP